MVHSAYRLSMLLLTYLVLSTFQFLLSAFDYEIWEKHFELRNNEAETFHGVQTQSKVAFFTIKSRLSSTAKALFITQFSTTMYSFRLKYSLSSKGQLQNMIEHLRQAFCSQVLKGIKLAPQKIKRGPIQLSW